MIQLLPLHQLTRKLQRLSMISDEVVIDNKHFIAPAQPAQYIQLTNNLHGVFARGRRP